MFASPLRCCVPIKNINGVLAIGNSSVGQIVSTIAGRAYSDKGKCDKERCSKSVPQTEGRRVEPWPKDEPCQYGWRSECSQEPQPPNYDPYRIKVPEVVVPPLPPSNAKEQPGEDARGRFRSPEVSFDSNTKVQDLFYNSPIVHPDYWKGKPERKKLSDIVKHVLPKLGYHGRNKYKYAFHEPWRPLDRLALLDEAEKKEVDSVNEDTVSDKNK